MELLSLLAVNVVICLILYVFFCLRINRVVKQKRNESVPPALRENIEMTVSFINSSLALVDQRLKTCYQMLRRTEELLDTHSKQTSRLKADDTSSHRSRKVPKNLHLKQKATGVSKNTKDKPKKNDLTGKKGKELKKELKSENFPASTSNSIPISPPPIPPLHKNQAQKSPFKTKHLVKDHVRDENHYQAEKVLDKLGVDRIEITTTPKNAQEAYTTDSSKSTPPVSPVSPASPASPASFSSLLDHSSEEGSTPPTPTPTTRSTPTPTPTPTTRSTTPPTPTPTTRSTPTPTTRPPTPTTRPPTSSIESSPLSLEPDENLKIVRVLFKKGYRAEDIASFLQISPAEVHLIASLPDDDQKRPRRNRTVQEFAS